MSAEEPWTLSYTGEGFAVTPDGGEFQRKGQKIAVFSPRASIEDDVALIPEDRNLQGLIGNMSIADNLVLKQTDEPQFSSLHGLHMKKKTISAYAREMIGKYDIRCQSSDQEVRNLSGGRPPKRRFNRCPAVTSRRSFSPASWNPIRMC